LSRVASTTHGRRRAVQLPSTHSGQPATVLVSSFSAAPGAVTESTDEFTTDSNAAVSPIDGDDPFAFESAGLYKVQTMTTQKPSLEARLKNMDLQDIIATLILPSVVVFAAGRWGFNKVYGKVQVRTEALLDSFAKEMLYHDGDYNEMKLCIQDYNQKLIYLPNRRDVMLKRYLAAYAKKKTVSPLAISSLSFVLTQFQMSEEAAAALLVSLCRQMGTDKIASAGKLLFLGSCILKSPEGQAALTPIKDLIKSTYREVSVAEAMVETSQQAIAEASYRSVVLAAGKQQKSLTPGWDVLGLERDVAQRIYDEEAKEGFRTERETMYGGQTTRYDKKGRIVDRAGKLKNPADADEDDDDEPQGGVSNVYECGECGYTLFVAQGRESKFFGTGFKCPECGAAKKQFKARDDMDEE
jgi:rubrerythrin